MPTVAEIVSIYPVAQYLATIDINKRGLFGGGVDVNLPRKIYMIGKTVERIYNDDPSDTTLIPTADFLYALCGKFGMQAQSISGDAGAIAGVHSTTVTPPNPLDFVVSGSSIIATGDASVNLSSFIGFNIEFVRGGITQNTTNIGGSYYTWVKSTGLFALSPAAEAGELLRISAV